MDQKSFIRREKINEFAALFEPIRDVAHLLGEDELQYVDDIRVKRALECNEQLKEIYFKHDGSIFPEILEEIEDNLYQLAVTNRTIYIKSIIKYFVLILPYFDFKNRERINGQDRNSQAYEDGYISPIERTLRTIELRKPYFESSIGHYVDNCYVCLCELFLALDEACLSFDLDLMNIQDQMGVHLPDERQWHILKMYGHRPPDDNPASISSKKVSNANNEPETSISKQSIFISLDARAPLLNALDPYVASSEGKEGLKALIEGKEPTTPIKIECIQTTLIYVFRQLKDKAKIPDDATQVRDWLVKWFRVKEYREMRPTTVYDGLTKDLNRVRPAEKSTIIVNI